MSRENQVAYLKLQVAYLVFFYDHCPISRYLMEEEEGPYRLYIQKNAIYLSNLPLHGPYEELPRDVDTLRVRNNFNKEKNKFIELVSE